MLRPSSFKLQDQGCQQSPHGPHGELSAEKVNRQMLVNADITKAWKCGQKHYVTTSKITRRRHSALVALIRSNWKWKYPTLK